MKKILTIIVTVAMIMSWFCIAAQAATTDNSVNPRWDNTAMITVGIHFLDNGKSYAESLTCGHFGTTKIASEVIVYKQYGSFWIQVAKESQITYGDTDLLICHFTPVAGAYYKAVFTVTVTKNSIDETITKTYYRTYE